MGIEPLSVQKLCPPDHMQIGPEIVALSTIWNKKHNLLTYEIFLYKYTQQIYVVIALKSVTHVYRMM